MPKAKAENSLLEQQYTIQGRAGRFQEVELAARLSGTGYSVGLSAVVWYSGVDVQWGGLYWMLLPIFGGLLSQVWGQLLSLQG